MADKNYLDFLDIPNGNSTERWHTRDVEAQAGIAQVASAIGYDTDYEFVDLGLPSGTLWAKCNVGAETETGYGNYYMYGKGASLYDKNDNPYSGTEDPLDSQYDTATLVMGAPWHMPTKEQMQELIDNTIFSWQTNFNGSGINGGKFTAANGNYIFLPAGGNWSSGYQSGVGVYSNCWSSTPKKENSERAYYKGCANGVNDVFDNARNIGIPVRGVASQPDLLIDVKGKLATKADKSELPVYATIATCQDIISELI